MNKLIALIAGGAVLLVAGGYFGLSAYSSKQAAKQLEDWSYDAELDEVLHWQSVSASPFGGRVTLSDVELELGKNQPSLRIAKVVITDRIEKSNRTRMRLAFEGVEADSNAFSSLRDLGVMAGREVDRNAARALHGFTPALNSGLLEMKPFDVELFVDVDDDDGIFETELKVKLPDLFDAAVSYRLENQRNLHRDLKRLEDIAAGANQYQLMESVGEVFEGLGRAEIAKASMSFKERGIAQRSIALWQRYNTPLDPTAGSADKQRKAHYEKVVEAAVKSCEREKIHAILDNYCELLGEFMLGDIKGAELTIKPSDPVKVQDLARLGEGRAGERVLQRLNLELDSL